MAGGLDRDGIGVGGGGGRRYQSLDLWRGAICLLVVLEHAGVMLWSAVGGAEGLDGWVRVRIIRALTWNFGTPLFFVISGYCIASSLESARRKGVGPAEFLARRAWRIFPTYWAALLLFVGVVAGLDAIGRADLHRHGLALELDSPGQLTASQWLGNLTLTETWRPIVAGTGISAVYTRVAWSLCYQEQFYLVCCLILWLTPTRLYRGLAWATGLTLAFRGLTADVGLLHAFDGTFPVRWQEFAAGLLVYWRLNAADAHGPRARHAADLALAGLAASAVFGGYFPAHTAVSAGFGLLLIAAHRWDGRLAAVGLLEPLRACGRRSFSIYLAHLPVTVVGNALLFQAGLTGFWARALVSLPLIVAASILAGWAFHAAVERHFLGTPTLPRLPDRTPTAGPTLVTQAA